MAHTPESVIVVGASSGIGRACAHRFARRGAQLALAARSDHELRRVADECRRAGSPEVVTFSTDVLDEWAVHRLVTETRSTFGHIDVVVFSAAVMAYGTIEAVPSAVFVRTVDTSLHGTANVARAALPVFREQQAGTFVVVTSLLASIPVPEMGAYVTGKWGQLGLARTLQLEVRDAPDIHVVTVAPGAVDTPIYALAANFAGRIARPPPPVADADDIAGAVVASVDRPRRTVVVGLTSRVATFGFRALPILYDALVGPLFRRLGMSADRVAATDGNVFDADAVVAVAARTPPPVGTSRARASARRGLP